MRIGHDEVEGVAQAGGLRDVGRAGVHGDDDGEVEGDLAPVEADQPSTVAVDLAGVELGDQLDASLLQHPAEGRRRGRLGERAIQRGDVGQLDAVTDAALVEVPVGQEAELERRHRALDGQIDHVDHDPSALEPLQRSRQRGSPFQVVEREDPLHPARPGQPLRLLGDQAGAGGHHQDVVEERRPVRQVHAPGLDVDVPDPALAELDARVELLVAGADDAVRVGQTERHEQQARLVDVTIIAVDHGDRDVGQLLAEPVRGQGATRARSQDDHPCAHGCALPTTTTRTHGTEETTA